MIEKIKTWWYRYTHGLCTKHGIPLLTHGYFNQTYCPDCRAEYLNKDL